MRLLATAALAAARLCLAAAMGAAGEAALRAATAWVGEREQFGAPLAELGPVQLHLAEMRLAVDAVRLAVDDAARRIDASAPLAEAVDLARGAKALADREAAEITRRSHQLLGGAGLYRDHPAHRRYRFVKVLEHLLH